MKVIGLTGYFGSGKDTAAETLAEFGWARIALADPVRQGLYRLNPGVLISDGHGVRTTPLASLVDTLGWDDAKRHPDVRGLLQRYGTEAGRDIHGEDCWLELAEERIDAIIEGEAVAGVVVTDIRFADEAEWLRETYPGSRLYRIRRPGIELRSNHSSETQIDYLDAIDVENLELGEFQNFWREVAKYHANN